MQPKILLPGDRVLQVNVRKLRRDPRLQPRAKVDPKTGADPEHVKRLLEQIKMGCDLTGGKDGTDPIMVFRDPPDDWLAHGYHRVAAYIEHGAREIVALVRNGTFRDAQLYALGCNKEPILQRDRHADIERIMRLILADPEWAGWSNVRIGRHCGVSDMTVGNWKRKLAWERKEAARLGRERRRQEATKQEQQEDEPECEDGEDGDDGSNLKDLTPQNGGGEAAPPTWLDDPPDGLVLGDPAEIRNLLTSVLPPRRTIDREEILERVEQWRRSMRKSIRQLADLDLGMGFEEGCRILGPWKMPAAH